MLFFFQCHIQAVTDGTEQGKSSNNGDHLGRKAGKKQHYATRKQSTHQIKHTIGNTGDITLVRFRVRIRAGTDRRSNGRHHRGDTTKQGRGNRHQRQRRNHRAGRDLITCGFQNRKAGQKLPRQADNHQWQRQAQRRANTPLRYNHRRRCQLPTQLAEIRMQHRERQGKPESHQQHQKVAPAEKLEHHKRQHHDRCHHRSRLQSAECPKAKIKQNTRHHGTRHPTGNQMHHPIKQTTDANKKQHYRSCNIGTNRLIQRQFGKQGNQQGGSRCRPGRNHRHPQPGTEANTGHPGTDGNCPHPRGHHLVGDIGTVGRLKHNRQWPGIRHQYSHQPRNQRGCRYVFDHLSGSCDRIS